jgi:trans-L-3-hydroxyproline dehydratase
MKQAITTNPDLHYLFQHPDSPDLGFLYSVVVTQKDLGNPISNTIGAETGLCFFADQQIDRSPTGSAVAARVALAYANGSLKKDEAWTYHSLLSRRMKSGGAFRGRVVDELSLQSRYPSVRARVGGFAYYVGYSTFLVEEHDPLGDDGFVFG